MAQEYKSADLESGLARAEGAAEKQTKMGSSRSSGGWKIGLALLAIGLCTAAAIFFAIHDQRWDITDKIQAVLTHILRKRDLWSDQLAIHLEGEYNTTASTIEWTDTRQDQGALKLINNKIIIPQTGLYFVYSRVSFSIDCHMYPSQQQQQQQRQQNERVYLHHEVSRTPAYDKERPLLTEMRSSCKLEPAQEDSGRRWYDTINLGAVFRLEEGDRLSTTTEPGADVASGRGKTYFGVFAV